MGLAFYDSTKTLFSGSPLKTSHNGRLGGADEKLIYIRNDDGTRYYTNITLTQSNDALDDSGEFGTTGWGVKFIYGERRPTEREWDDVPSSNTVNIPDIGSTSAADTSTYHPIWVRVYCPGGEPEQERDNQNIDVSFYERLVGA